jgi:hypothetical protein
LRLVQNFVHLEFHLRLGQTRYQSLVLGWPHDLLFRLLNAFFTKLTALNLNNLVPADRSDCFSVVAAKIAFTSIFGHWAIRDIMFKFGSYLRSFMW